MDDNSEHGRSQLFLVRLWERSKGNAPADESTDEGRQSCCGTVQHTISGRTTTFRGWDELNAALSELRDIAARANRR